MPTARRGLTNGLGRKGPGGIGRTNGLVNGTRGRTNGLVNGTRGRTNGLVNGTRGRTNGLVNGTRAWPGQGIVNGNGLVNGSGFVNGLPLRRNPFGIVTHRDLRRGVTLLVIATLAVPILAFFLSAPPPPGPGFIVDESFAEWPSVPMFPDDLDDSSGPDIARIALHFEEARLFVYGNFDGDVFPGPEPTSVFVLLDGGGSGGTKYAVARDFDADAIAEVYGWDGAVQGTRIRIWSGASDVHNASSFRRGGGFPAEAIGGEIELSIDLDTVDLGVTPELRVRVATQGAAGGDLSTIVGPAMAALVVRQTPRLDPITSAAPVLNVTLEARGADIRVANLWHAFTGPRAPAPPTFPIVVPGGDSQNVSYRMDPSALATGTLLGVRVFGGDAVIDGTSTTVPVTVYGDESRFYVGTAPAGKTVDGAFSEWTNLTSDPDDPDASVPDNVDLRALALAIQSDTFIYARTQGPVLGGATLPERPLRPKPAANGSASSPPVTIPRIAGEDVLRVYIDTDDRDVVGYPFNGIFADRLVEVRGRLGLPTSRAAFAWDAPAYRWVPRSETVEIALVGPQLEASVPASFLGPTNNASVVLAASDWSGIIDLSDPSGLRGTRGAIEARPTDGTNFQNVSATVLTNTPDVTDADCASFAGEYDGATNDGNANITFYVGRRDDTQNVFVCVEVTSDTVQNSLDYGEILFDTNHDDVDPPQDEDRMFRLSSGPFALLAFKGDGIGGWTSCGTSCDSGNNGTGNLTNGQEVYEFRIRYSDVWGTNTPDPGDRAGFAIIVYDADVPVFYWWGADDVDETMPSTWGQLDIPEFPGLGFLVAFAIVPVALRIRGRRGRQL